MLVPIQYDSDSGHFCFSSFSRLDMILCCLGLQLGKLERSDCSRSPPSIWHSWIPHHNGNSPVRTFRCPSGRRGLSVLSLLFDWLPVHGSWTETKASFDFDTIPRLIHLDSWISLCYSHIPLLIHSTDGNNLFLTTDSKYLSNQWLGPVSAWYDDKLKSRSNYAQLTDVCRDMCASVTEAPFWVLRNRIWPTVEI